jgi:hypothetical protein
MITRADKPKAYFSRLLDQPESEIDYSEIPPTTATDWRDAEVMLPVTADEFQGIKKLLSQSRKQHEIHPEEAAQAPVPIDQDGHIEQGTTLHGKTELFALLETWLVESSADTIGDVGTFGRRPWIFIDLGHGRRAVLNADTKRKAVEGYVCNARERGIDSPWWVLPNRRGPINKLVFREDQQLTPGWYCYLEPAEVSIGTL